MRRSSFFAGYALGLLTLAACAGVTYRYYGIEMPVSCYQEGKLLGKSPNDSDWGDLPLNKCMPDLRSLEGEIRPATMEAGKCVVQLKEDFFKKDKALKDCQAALDRCEHPEPPQ